MIDHVVLHGDTLTVETVERNALASGDDACDGEMCSATNRIRIRDDCDPQGFLRILGHEITHFLLFQGGLNDAIKACCHAEEHGKALIEGICDFMGAGLVEVIRDNPDLVNAIRKVYADKALRSKNDQ